MVNANEALFGAGSGKPSWGWGRMGEAPGRKISGYITDLDGTQQRDQKGNPKFWPSGDKMLIALITIATDERDPAIDEDDGQRVLWVSGRNMTTAVKEAVKEAGKREVEIGGYLEVEHTGYAKADKDTPEARTFEAVYRKPTRNAAASAALNGPSQSLQEVDEDAPGGSVPEQPSEAVSGAVGAGNGASSGRMVDLSTLPPAARAIIEKQMQGQQ